MKTNLLLALGLSAGFALPRLHAQVAAAVDQFVTDTDNYNLVSLGNATFNQVSDTAGGVAINGSFTIENNATTLVGMSWASSSMPSLYFTGPLTITNGDTVQLNNGFASTPDAAATGWSWSSSAKTLTKSGQGTLHYNSGMVQDPTNPANNPNWNWSSLASQFQSVSSTLASASTAGDSVSVSGQTLGFTTTQTSGAAVFNLNAALLTQSGGSHFYNGTMISGLSVNVPTGLTYVINVTNLASGTSFLSGININSGSNDNNLLWNFSNATDGNFTFANGGKFFGSVLAPGLTLTSDTAQEGQLVVGSFTQNSDELDQVNTVPLVAIPEISTYALWLGSLCALIVALRRHPDAKCVECRSSA